MEEDTHWGDKGRGWEVEYNRRCELCAFPVYSATLRNHVCDQRFRGIGERGIGLRFLFIIIVILVGTWVLVPQLIYPYAAQMEQALMG